MIVAGDEGMRTLSNGFMVAATVAMLAAVGACAPSQLTEIGSVNLLPSVGNLSRPDWLTYSGNKDEFTLRAVTPADLVSAEGQCAATEEQMRVASAELGPDAVPQEPGLLPGGIALQMTECDVVRRAGAPEQIQIGADERGDRATVITYIRGPRPGIYRFVAGRLTSIERAPEPPAARSAPKKKSSKKSARS
jgi:hypothetical protein